MRILNEKPYRWLVLVCNTVGGALVAISGFYGWDNTRSAYGLLILGLVVLAAPPAVPLIMTIRVAGLDHRDHALKLLTELCHLLLGCPTDCDVRVTLLRVNHDHEVSRLKPFTRAPGASVPESGMSTAQGVAGMCYRTKKVAIQHDVKDFFASMLEFGFTEDEARKFRQDRRTYLCVPVFNAQKEVVAVLSCDAAKPNIFTDPRVTVAETLTPFFARLLATREALED